MLREHFHPPLQGRRHWESFHSAWATMLAAALNQQLPQDWFAEPTASFGIEIDVATWDDSERMAAAGAEATDVAAVVNWSPAPPTLTLEFPIATDIVQIAVYESSAGPVLAGAIELISPANKDRREHRDAFTSKCESMLREGVGVMIVDIVTNRYANLHSELLKRLGSDVTHPSVRLYAASYRPTERDEQEVLDVWHQPLVLEQSLPPMPLFLKGGPCLQVDLAATYQQTCQQLRLN